MNIKEQIVVINLLWAARELDAGRELTVEGAAYLAAAEEFLIMECPEGEVNE